ncbi:MAG: hypothetical protein M1389_09405, partial [Chloroflexi bacterium]|nr:hypothetical protein [Chloroflexota bacterium]
MAIPVSQLQATGDFHVPGVCEPITGYHVREALGFLDPYHRAAVEGYLKACGEGALPSEEALWALRGAVLQIV